MPQFFYSLSFRSFLILFLLSRGLVVLWSCSPVVLWSLKRPDSIAHPIARGFHVLGDDVAGELAGGLAGAGGGLAGIEFDVGGVVAETVEGTSGMIPGGDEDDAMGARGAQQGDGELGILLRAHGGGFELDGFGGHTA